MNKIEGDRKYAVRRSKIYDDMFSASSSDEPKRLYIPSSTQCGGVRAYSATLRPRHQRLQSLEQNYLITKTMATDYRLDKNCATHSHALSAKNGVCSAVLIIFQGFRAAQNAYNWLKC
jgi:hypothetical protein